MPSLGTMFYFDSPHGLVLRCLIPVAEDARPHERIGSVVCPNPTASVVIRFSCGDVHGIRCANEPSHARAIEVAPVHVPTLALDVPFVGSSYRTGVGNVCRIDIPVRAADLIGRVRAREDPEPPEPGLGEASLGLR